MAEWIWMPFGVVSGEWGWSRDGSIRWGGDRRKGRRRAVLGVNLGRPINQWGLCCKLVQCRVLALDCAAY